MRVALRTAVVCCCALALVLAAAVAARAAEAPLKIGDPAPKLAQGKYVQGEPVKEFEKGKVYVVEFWATWCGPCIAAIPHVNDLQKKHADKGLIVIGQNCWERDEAKVEPFLKQMGEKMTYRVAMDDKSQDPKGAMATTWMAAAGRNGIPCSFIVDQEARVAWIGHPMTMDKPLEQILEKKWDIAAFKAEFDAQQAVAVATQEVAKLAAAKQWDEALAKIAEVEKSNPAAGKRLAATKYVALKETKKDDAAAALVEELLKNAAAEPAPLLMIGQRAVVAKEYDLALKMAATIGELKTPYTLSAHLLAARAHAGKGDFAKAVEAQKLAVEAATTPQAKAAYERQLKAYEEQAAKAKTPV